MLLAPDKLFPLTKHQRKPAPLPAELDFNMARFILIPMCSTCSTHLLCSLQAIFSSEERYWRSSL